MTYERGDRFLFAPRDWNDYDEEIHELLCRQRTILEIKGFLLFQEGHLGYCLAFVEPQYEWVWGLTREEVDTDLVYLGESEEDSRFVFLGD